MRFDDSYDDDGLDDLLDDLDGDFDKIDKIVIIPTLRVNLTGGETIIDSDLMYQSGYCKFPNEFMCFFMLSREITTIERMLFFYLYQQSIDYYFGSNLKKFINISDKSCKVVLSKVGELFDVGYNSLHRSLRSLTNKKIITYDNDKSTNTYTIKINHNFTDWEIEKRIIDKMMDTYKKQLKMRKQNYSKLKHRIQENQS